MGNHVCMANIPTPAVAKGTAAGAQDGRSPDEFHDGSLYDIRDYGASVDGSSDDSSAITSAISDASADGGAVYFPAGTTASSEIKLGQSANGVTLVGEGADSEFKALGSYGIAFRDSGGPVRNVTVANLRVNANGKKYGLTSSHNGHDDGPITVENVWIHSAQDANVRAQLKGMTFRNCSSWNTTRFHGFTMGNDGQGSQHLTQCVAWDCGSSSNNRGGIGFDCSGSRVVVDRCISVNNKRGMKTTGQTVNTEIRNTALLNSTFMGFYSSGRNDSADVVLDRVLAKGNGGEGFSFRASNYTSPSCIWSIDNCATGAGQTHAGVEYAYGATMDVSEMQVCGTQNGYPGIQDTTSDSSGTISTLIATDNDGANVKDSGVQVETIENTQCEVPYVKDLVGSPSPSVRHYDGESWQDASIKYHDGQQFTDASISQL